MRKVVSLKDLKIGDVLQEAIKDADDIILIAKGTVLTDNNLRRLRRWAIDQESLVAIDDGTEEYNPNDVAEVKERSLRHIKDIIATDDEEQAKVSIEKLSELIDIMANNMENITTIPSDILKIDDADTEVEHYYRVARLAMAIASIYNQEASEEAKVSLTTVGMAAYLHDYGKKYSKSYDSNNRLKVIARESVQPSELGGNNQNKNNSAYAYIALRDKVDLAVRKTLLFGGFDEATLSKSSDKKGTIPARIIKLCDIYDGLLNLISKKNISQPAECVIEYMSEVAEMKEISKEMYEVFASHLPLYVRGTRVLLSNNQYAVVVENGEEPTKPQVLTLTGGAPTLINLGEREDLTIKRIDNKGTQQEKKINSDALYRQLENGYKTLTKQDELEEMLKEEAQKARQVAERNTLSKRFGMLLGAGR